MNRRILAVLSVALVMVLAASLHVDRADANPRTFVYINGRPASVYVSDGDTFRVHSGPYTGNNSRLAGFNALESFGPAHQWGNWHAYELYINSKMATLNARRGVWHCTSEGEFDTYGRVLINCPDLAVDQIRRGFAHAMNVDDTPSRPEYLRAQRQAIRERRGMWAHGVPAFMLTSLHSADEDPDRDTTYNRMISTRDGHSEKWEHADDYSECQRVCATELVADEGRVVAFARRLRADPEVAGQITWMSNLLLTEVVDRYARLGRLPEWMTTPAYDANAPHVAPLLEGRLRIAKRSGELGEPTSRPSACMTYVVFERRYGAHRPWCLRGHGDER